MKRLEQMVDYFREKKYLGKKISLETHPIMCTKTQNILRS